MRARPSAATKIGFVGLGHMGGTMAARLLTAGYPTYGEERTRAHAQQLVHSGLRWRDTPREVAQLPTSSSHPSPTTRYSRLLLRGLTASSPAFPPERSGSK